MASSQRSSYARRQLRQELRRFCAQRQRLLVATVVLTLTVCAVPLLLDSPAYVTGTVHAGVPLAMLGVVGFAFLLSGNVTHLLAGSYGEAYTQEELETARGLGHVWGSVHNLELERGDVDSIVLSPAGVLALETKWRFDKADDRWLVGAAAQAERNAARTRSVLRSKGLDEVHDVRPVLVVWGGAQVELADVRTVGTVAVVPGRRLVAWLDSCSTGPMAQDNAAALLGRLSAFADSRVIT